MSEFTDESGKLPKTLQDLRDRAAEEATDGNGPKAARFDVKGREERQRSEEKRKAEAQRMSAFQVMMLNDPEYRALYERVSTMIDDVQAKLDQAILENAADIERMEDSAVRLEDGTMVFQAADGTVYTQDGQIVPERARPASFPEDAPSWGAYLVAKLRRVELAAIQTDTVDAARDELRNQQGKPDKQRLGGIETILQETEQALDNKSSLAETETTAEAKNTSEIEQSLGGMALPKPI